MTKFEVSDAMVEAAIRGHLSNDEYMYDMRAAITAAIEASGLAEENERLREALIWIEDCCTITSASEYIQIIESCKAVAQREINKEPTR